MFLFQCVSKGDVQTWCEIRSIAVCLLFTSECCFLKIEVCIVHKKMVIIMSWLTV